MMLYPLHLYFPVGTFIVGLLDTSLVALVFLSLLLPFFFGALRIVSFEVSPPIVLTFQFPP